MKFRGACADDFTGRALEEYRIRLPRKNNSKEDICEVCLRRYLDKNVIPSCTCTVYSTWRPLEALVS